MIHIVTVDEVDIAHKGGASEAVHRIEFITRRGCHLCDEALCVVRRVGASVDFALEIVDVDSSAELQEDHGGYVPVVIVDGRRFAAYHVDAEALRARIVEASTRRGADAGGDSGDSAGSDGGAA